MTRLTTIVASAALLAISWPVGAQTGELGFEGKKERSYPGQFGERYGGPQRDRDSMVQRRLEKAAEFLELNEEQSLQWQVTIDEQRHARQALRDRVNNWREEFRQVAKAEEPDLMRLGEIALAIHREVEDLGSSRDQLKTQLTKILTPEQADKFDALMAAREVGQQGTRGRRRRSPAQAPGDG